MNQELPDVQAAFRKGSGNKDQIVNIHWIIEEAREFQKKKKKKTYFCFTDYMKAFVCITKKQWKILKEMGIPDHLTCLLRNPQVKKQLLQPYMEQLTGSKLGKEYDKAVYCHPTYLTHMQKGWAG